MSVVDARFDVLRANEFIGGTASLEELEVGGQPVGATTLASAGGGVSLVEDGAPLELQLRSLVAGANVALAVAGGEVEIAASAGPGATLDDAGAVPAGGASLVPGAPQAGPGLTVRTVSGGAAVAVAEGATDVALTVSVPLALAGGAAGASAVSGGSTGLAHLLRGLRSGDGSVRLGRDGEDVLLDVEPGATTSIPLGSTQTAAPGDAAAPESVVASDSAPTDHRLKELVGGAGVAVGRDGEAVRVSRPDAAGEPTTTITFAHQEATDPGSGSTFTGVIGPESTSTAHLVKRLRRRQQPTPAAPAWLQVVPGSADTLLRAQFDAGLWGRGIPSHIQTWAGRIGPDRITIDGLELTDISQRLTYKPAVNRGFNVSPAFLGVSNLTFALLEGGGAYEIRVRLSYRYVSGAIEPAAPPGTDGRMGLRGDFLVNGGLERAESWLEEATGVLASRPVLSMRFAHQLSVGPAYEVRLFFDTSPGDASRTTVFDVEGDWSVRRLGI